MATFQKIHAFVEAVAEGGHNLGSDTLKVALTNTAPAAASDSVWSAGSFPPPLAANGYTAGGNTLTVSSSAQSGGLYKLVLADSVFTAGAGGMGPFRYAVIYNATSGNRIIGFYDYGSSITLGTSGDTFTIDFSSDDGVLTLQ
jgi:hypothetical protein